MCPGPGLKSSEPIADLRGRAMEIDAAVFPGQDRCQSCARIVLLGRLKSGFLQSVQRFDHEASAELCQFWCECYSSIVRKNERLALHQDVAGIKTRVNSHGGDAGDGFSLRDS